MAERLSREVRTILAQADMVARATGRPTTSVHYLVATYLVECQARELLAETGVDDARVLDTYEKMQEREDSAEALKDIHRQAEQLAESTGSLEVTSTILLASMLRVRHALASRVLDRAGVNLPGLRARVIGQVTLQNDRATTGSRPAVRMPDDRGPSRTDLPSLREGRVSTSRLEAVQAPRAEPHPDPGPTRRLPVPSIDQVQARAEPTPRPQAQQVPVQTAQPQRETPQPRPPAKPKKDDPGAVRELDPAKYPALNELGRNLTAAALRGEIDPIVGRDDIIDAVIDILLMKQVNNPCLIGEAGVGKTAIAEGLALKLVSHPELYGRLGTAVLVEIQVSSLLAGTALRGAFSERMRKLRDEVAKADGQVIVFMDEIHTIMGAGTGDGPMDAANDLKSALSRGKFPLIGATTRAEYERHILKDPAMERRFQVVPVPEPTVPEAVTILAGVAPIYARHHEIRYSHDAIQSAVHLSKRFITDQCLPHKAIAVLDRAGAQAKRAGRPMVMADDVARAVHVLTGVPMERLLADERGRIRDLAGDLQARIVGHDPAMQRVARRIQRNYAGFSGERPVASFLFVGAPGSGKTETARAVAETLFIHGDALVRFDMTEYAEPHTVSRLVGSPPGYVGHGQQGLLAQALQKRPYRVLLFDEVDRAAPEVLALLLQLLDAGHVTDHHGHLIDVRNCIVIMTSNLGAELLVAGVKRRPIGFGSVDAPLPEGPVGDPLEQLVLDRAKASLPAEFWSRIDDVIVFRPLTLPAARLVVERALQTSAQRLYEARLIRYTADASVIDLILQNGLDPSLGVRPLRSRIEALVEAFVTDCILDGRLQPGSDALLTVEAGSVVLRPALEPLAS
jgi:ATP-dependent Clp protease ATP-binding subunit ClpC